MDADAAGVAGWLQLFSGIFSGYYAKIDENDINARFNGISDGKLFILADEIKGQSKHDAVRLKSIVTQKTII